MSQTRMIGLALIVAGILSFSYEGLITFKTRDKVFDAGPVQVTTEKTHKIRLPQLAGAVCLIGGMILIVATVKRA